MTGSQLESAGKNDSSAANSQNRYVEQVKWQDDRSPTRHFTRAPRMAPKRSFFSVRHRAACSGAFLPDGNANQHVGNTGIERRHRSTGTGPPGDTTRASKNSASTNEITDAPSPTTPHPDAPPSHRDSTEADSPDSGCLYRTAGHR